MHDLRLVVQGLILLFFLIRAVGAQEQHGRLTGVVVDHQGQPLRKAHVILHHDNEEDKSIITAENGTFTIGHLTPGRLTITVNKDGYIDPAKRPQRVTIPPATTASITLTLQRTGSITGTVTDEDGDPIMGASIQIQRWPRKKNQDYGNMATTDDRGSYRAYLLSPGDYTVTANFQDRREGNIHGRPRGTYPPTSYPGTTDPTAAGLVRVTPGSETTGIDIPLQRATGVTITGMVTGEPKDGPRFLAVSLEPIAPRGTIGSSRNTIPRDGRFTLYDVFPGSYRATARSEDFNNEHQLTVQQPVIVGAEDIHGLLLHLHPPVTLTGTITTPPGRTLPNGLLVILAPRDAGNQQSGGAGTINPDGRFHLTNVSTGTYDMMLGATSTVADDLYVSSIRQGTTDALTDGITIGEEPPAALEIVMQANGGTLDCTVNNATGDFVPESALMLVPDPPRHRQVTRLGNCSTNEQGNCTIKGIAPGEYHAYAFPNGMDMDYRDPDTYAPYTKYGKVITIGTGERQHVQLNEIPEE